MSLSKELLEVIKSNLPEAQSEAIRQSLNELEDKKAEVTKLKTQIEGYKRANTEFSDELGQLRAATQSQTALITTLQKSLDEAKGLVVSAQVTQARAELNAVERTVDKFLGNTIIREAKQHTIIGEFPNVQWQPGPNGVSHQAQIGVNKVPQQVQDVTTTEDAAGTIMRDVTEETRDL